MAEVAIPIINHPIQFKFDDLKDGVLRLMVGVEDRIYVTDLDMDSEISTELKGRLLAKFLVVHKDYALDMYKILDTFRVREPLVYFNCFIHLDKYEWNASIVK